MQELYDRMECDTLLPRKDCATQIEISVNGIAPKYCSTLTLGAGSAAVTF
jgi:hypothetical protein